MSFNLDKELADIFASYYSDPLGFVMFAWDWKKTAAIQMVKLAQGVDAIMTDEDKRRRDAYRTRFKDFEYGPDLWACDFLDQWGQEIETRGFDGRVAVPPIQFSVASGHGIGKTTLAAWIVHFIMATRPFCHGTVTANTDIQLRTKTWAGIGAWYNRFIAKHWFLFSSGRGSMRMAHREFPADWFCTAQTSREENSESFAGQHAANSTSFYLFDEASGIVNKIYEVREGGLTDGEPMTFDFGNPTKNSGAFFENTVGRQKHRYLSCQIDARHVAITNKLQQQKMIDDYGIDSDRVKVRVLGQFPSRGSGQFNPTHVVDAAMRRELGNNRLAPLVIGVDVARHGPDNTVIYPRLGNDARSFPPRIFNGLDTNQVVAKVIETIKDFKQLGKSLSGLFIDEGYNPGVIDNLRHLGFNPIGVHFGGSALDGNTYRFRVDEMWGRLREHMETDLALPLPGQPSAEELRDQLIQREFDYTNKGQINLESKKEMKERLSDEGTSSGSPDIADALALTYAQDVALAVDPVLAGQMNQPMTSKHEYDPLEATW